MSRPHDTIMPPKPKRSLMEKKQVTSAQWPDMTRYRLAAQNLKLAYDYFPAGPGLYAIRVTVPEGKEQDWTAELRRPDLLDGICAP